MSIKWEKEEGNTGTLTVEVPVEKVNAGLSQAFKKVVKEVESPGFGTGKRTRPSVQKM